MLVIPLRQIEEKNKGLYEAKKNRTLVEYYFTNSLAYKGALETPRAKATYLDSDIFSSLTKSAMAGDRICTYGLCGASILRGI